MLKTSHPPLFTLLAFVASACNTDPGGAPGGTREVGRGASAAKARGHSGERTAGTVKVVVSAQDPRTLDRVQAVAGSRLDYASFSIFEVVETELRGLGLDPSSYRVREDLDLIRIEGYPIDARAPEAVVSALPPGLRFGHLSSAAEAGRSPPAGLYLVQLAGPVRDEWRSALEKGGLRVVSYVPENAYLVWAEAEAARALPALVERSDFVQLATDYEPAYKLHPSLRGEVGEKVELAIQLYAAPTVERALAEVARRSLEVHGRWEVGPYHNLHVLASGGQVAELARIAEVVAVQPRPERRRLDEAQGQILAGAIGSGAPTGPGYLAFLAGAGFDDTQLGDFSVNVVDDSHLLTGAAQHPDLAAGRVAFELNPTNNSSTQGGHGFLNAHIVGGLSEGTGAAVEDGLGFNYGLGVAPWARVGVTDIFGNTFAAASTWENLAYSAGARVSSNSWGYVSLYDYDLHAQEYDFLVRDAQSGTNGLQELTVVFAAGNDGPFSNSVASPGTAKNIITVGASEGVRTTGTDGCAVDNSGADNCDDLAFFSSRGPVNTSAGDGRVKPELVAPGTHIEAGVPQGGGYNGDSVCDQYFPIGQTLYGWSSGTSHSCPAVAGGAALVRQHFANQGRAAPSPAMVKAFLAGSAAYMSGSGANDTLPSNNQGMGRMDLGRAFDATPRIYADQTQLLTTSGATYSVTGNIVDPGEPFRVALAWTDAPGPTTGAPWVNDLNLSVTVASGTYLGNVFSGGTSVTGGTATTRNNLESVFLPAGTTGAFTVTITAFNVAGDGVPGNGDPTDQDFALVIYNAEAVDPSELDVAPATLSFGAQAGGASPPSQTLAITNAVAGALSWTIATDQPWLTVSAASGAAPASVEVSASAEGLSSGTYLGNVVVSGAGAVNSPLTVPVTFVVIAPSPSGGRCDAPALALGDRHTCLLRADSTVSCWGSNAFLQVGIATTGNHLTPQTVAGVSGAVALAAGASHTCALLDDGTVWCWGRNNSGQLGDGTLVNRFTPAQVAGLPPIVAIAAGQTHTCALASDTQVWCWGNNGSGRLGDGTTTRRTTPVQVPNLSGVTSLTAGIAHTCVLVDGGEDAYCWGNNAHGQLGDASNTRRLTPVRVASARPWRNLSAGQNHTCGVHAGGDGAVECWGRNNAAQLGDETLVRNRNIPAAVLAAGSVPLIDGVLVSAGASTSCAILGDGSLACWGKNNLGQTGDGTNLSPRRAAVTTAAPVGLAGRILTIARGLDHGCAFSLDGGLFCWGSNANGQLGDGTRTRRFAPVPIGGVDRLSFAAFVDEDSFDAAGTLTQATGVIADAASALFVVGLSHDGAGTTSSWHVRRSDDLGATFTSVDTFTYEPLQLQGPPAISRRFNGSLYVAGEVADASGIGRWLTRQSADSGESWTASDDFAYREAKPAGANRVSQDDSGRTFVAGYGDDADDVSHWLVRVSPDDGHTWSTADDYAYPGATRSIARQVAGGGGGLYAAGTVEVGGASRLLVRASSDGGATWSNSDELEYEAGQATTAQGITTDSAGRVFVVAQAGTSAGVRWVVRRSVDQGATWVTVDDLQAEVGLDSTPSSLVIDRAGTLLATGTVMRADGTHCLVRASYDHGASWTTIEECASPGTLGLDLAQDAAGGLHLAGASTTAGTYVGSVRGRTCF